ncbi:EamA family transporter [Saccharopolyspora sp. CA-218241]|uniref:EamA family transporter n=1 Tax=Saccharopolyspora sp. CA-218241 TaxID=3240027 RepID=UPI003D982E99
MGLTAVLLVVAAAFAHAGWNFFAKRAGSGGAVFVWLTAGCSTVLYLPVAAGALLVDGVPPWRSWVLGGVVGAVVQAAYSVVLQRGYAVGDMSVVYPLARGTGPMLAMVIAVVVLGERPGALGVLGGALVVLGVLVIGFSDGLPRAGAGLTGVGFGLLCGALIGIYTTWDAYAVTALGLSPLLYEWTSTLLRTLLLSPRALADPGRLGRVWRAHRREVLAVAVLSPLAYSLVLFAMRLAPVSLVAPARELSIVLAGLLAWRLLGEDRPVRRLSGAAVVLAGVVLLGIA